MLYKKPIILVTGSVIIVSSLSGCGKGDPGSSLQKALDTQTNSSKQTVTSYLQIDPKNVIPFAREMQTANGGKENPKDIKTLQNLIGTRVSFETASKDNKPLLNQKNLKNVNWGFFVNNGNDTLVSAMSLNNSVYLKTDVQKIGQLTSLYNQADIGSLKSSVGSNSWVNSLIANQWLDFGSTFNSYTDGLAGNPLISQVQMPKDGPTKAQLNSFAKLAKKDIKAQTKVTWKDEYVKVEIPVKKLAPILFADAKKSFPNKIGASKTKDYQSFVNSINYNPITVLFKIKDNRITQVKMSVSQFAKIIDTAKVNPSDKKQIEAFAKYPLDLVIDISTDAKDLVKPSKSRAVSKSDLESLFAGITGGNTDGPSGSGSGVPQDMTPPDSSGNNNSQVSVQNN